MDGMRILLERIRVTWSAFSFNQKAIVGIVLGAILVSVVIFTVWLRSDSMVVLYSNLGPEEASTALDHISKQGVKAELRNGGGTILVPSQHLDRLRMELAVQGVGGDGLRGWDLFDEKVMGETDFTLNVRLKRALEGELARSIASIEQVERARVHINTPKPSLFARDERPASASVVLTLRGRSAPERSQIEGVQNLVASAVDGIETSHVTVIDAATGKVLSGASTSDATGMSNAQLQLRKEVEDYLAGKATAMLGDVLGPGRFVVRVNADLDFEKIERTKESFDPNTVVRSEESDESTDPTTGGNSTNSITNYEVSRTVETVLRNGSLLKKLMVSVAVDGVTTPATDGGATAYSPRSSEELDQIRRMVSSAVGLDATRGDQIDVVNMPFDAPEPYVPSMLESPWLHDLPSLVGRLLLFLVAAGLVLSLRKSLGRLLGEASQPRAARSANAGVGLSMGAAIPSVSAEVSGMEDWVRNSPDEVAKLIKAYATQED